MKPHMHLDSGKNHIFTKPCRTCQTYQNYEQPPQRSQNSDCHSENYDFQKMYMWFHGQLAQKILN